MDMAFVASACLLKIYSNHSKNMKNLPLHEQTKRSNWPELPDATNSISAESQETKGDLWEMLLAGF